MVNLKRHFFSKRVLAELLKLSINVFRLPERWYENWRYDMQLQKGKWIFFLMNSIVQVQNVPAFVISQWRNSKTCRLRGHHVSLPKTVFKDQSMSLSALNSCVDLLLLMCCWCAYWIWSLATELLTEIARYLCTLLL